MNLIERFYVWRIHAKLELIGDKNFDKTGTAYLPCKICGKFFQSWMHLDSDFGMNFDSWCPDCKFNAVPPQELKRDVERILSDYEIKLISWTEAKKRMSWLGYVITHKPQRCDWCHGYLTGKEKTLAEILKKYPDTDLMHATARYMLDHFNVTKNERFCGECFSRWNQ